jgi:MFS family permease
LQSRPAELPAPAVAAREATTTAVTVVALAFLFNFIGRGVADGFAAFILPLEAEFGWRRQSMTGVFATYMLVAGLAAPATGLMFDRLGPRIVYTIGLVLLGAGAWLSGQVTQLWQLYLSAGLMVGAGVAALGMVCAATLIGRWYRRNLSTAIAIAYAGLGSGVLVMLPLVQWLIERFGWRIAYESVGMAALLLAPLCWLLPWRRLARDAPESRVGSQFEADDGWTLGRAVRSLAYWRLFQAFFFTAVAVYLVTPQIVAFFISAGLTPLAAASAYGFAGLMSTGGVVGAGWLADRFGYGRIALLTFCCTALGLLALLAVSYAASLAAVLCYVFFFGIAQGARGPIVSMLSNRIFTGRSAATIYGTIFSSMAIGAAVGAYAGGVLHDLTGSYRPILVLSLVALALAAEPFRAGTAIARSPNAGRR